MTSREPEQDDTEAVTRRTVLSLTVTAVSFAGGVLLEREVLYRGYGVGGYGNEEYGG